QIECGHLFEFHRHLRYKEVREIAQRLSQTAVAKHGRSATIAAKAGSGRRKLMAKSRTTVRSAPKARGAKATASKRMAAKAAPAPRIQGQGKLRDFLLAHVPA